MNEIVQRDDHGPHAPKELRDWPLATLRYELYYQQAEGIHTYGPGHCGHTARGSGFCAACLQVEIDRRKALLARDGSEGEL